MNRLSGPARILGAAAVAVFVAACSSQGGATPVPSVASQPSAAAGGSPTVYTVDVHQDATLGAFLTGEDGKSLYLLTKDSANTSTCTDQCASAWPPFILESGETVVAGTGVTGTLGTIKRPDGSDQVAINGLPLYYFSGDTGAAQTNGQGVKGVWFLASPSGTTVGSPAASPGGTPAATEQTNY